MTACSVGSAIDERPQPNRNVRLFCRYRANTGRSVDIAKSSFLTQAVWKRFSYPNNCKQQGVIDLDATG